MRLPMYLAIIYHLISVTGAPLNFIYEVIPDKKTNTKYKGTTTLVTHNRSTLTAVECAGICEEATGCGGFNYCEISAGYRTCEAVEANKEPIDPTELRWFKGCFYFHKSTGQCLNGGVMENGTCLCSPGYTNTYCEDFVQDCVTSYNHGYRKTKNVVIQPNRTEDEFKVECRLHEGPVTRILMREQGKIDFSNLLMNWYNYMYGFYYPQRENSWIGLERLHSILVNSPYNHTAKVTVVFQNDTTEYTGYYGNFYVDSEETSYTLTYTNFWAGENPLDDGFSGSGQNDSSNGQPFCPSVRHTQTCGSCTNSTSVGGWFGSGCYYVRPFSVLEELVWPNASILLPVDILYFDIIANIP